MLCMFSSCGAAARLDYLGNGPAAPGRYAPAAPCRLGMRRYNLRYARVSSGRSADLADGIGGGYTAERRLEIMKDSATGAFGALAVVLAILLKTSAIYSLIIAKGWIFLAVVPAMSRFAIVVAAYKSPCARTTGLAKSGIEFVTRHPPRRCLICRRSDPDPCSKVRCGFHRSSHAERASGPGTGLPASRRCHWGCARRGQRNYRSCPLYIVGLPGVLPVSDSFMIKSLSPQFQYAKLLH